MSHGTCCSLRMSGLSRPIGCFGRYSSFKFPSRRIQTIPLQAASPTPRKPLSYIKHKNTTFSTMPTLNDNVTAVPAQSDQFDSDITDVAAYVHNYKVNSKLAVRCSPSCRHYSFGKEEYKLADHIADIVCSLTQLDLCSWTPLDAASKPLNFPNAQNCSDP